MTSYFELIDFLAPERSGMALATERRLTMMAEQLLPVTVLTLDFQRDHQGTIEALREAGRLHPAIAVHNFHQRWYLAAEAAPVDWDSPVHAWDEPGLTGHLDLGRELADSRRYYDADGRYTTYKRFDEDGRLVFVDHQSINLQRTHRVEYHPDGPPVREIRYNLQTGRPAYERYFDRSGACYLSCWVNSVGRRTKSVLHGSGTAVEELRELQAEWAGEVIAADGDDSVLMLDELGLLPTFARVPAGRRVVTLHNTHLDAPHTAGSPLRTVYGQILQQAAAFDAVVFLTDEQRRDVAEEFGDRDNFVVIPHGLVPGSGVDRPDPPARRAHSAITLARLEDSKNVADAIRAFRIVVDDVPDAVYRIYGYGSLRTELTTLIADLQLTENVFIEQFTDRVDEELQRHACSVMTSRFEGFCLAILESLANRTPAISYRVKYGPADLIDHGVNGFLAEPGNHRQIAAYLLQVFTDPELQASLAEGCVKVRETYSYALFQRRWLQLFGDLESAGRREPTLMPEPLARATAVITPASGGPVIPPRTPDVSLAERATTAGRLPLDAAQLAAGQHELGAVDLRTLVIVGGPDAEGLGVAVADFYERTRVHLVIVGPAAGVVPGPDPDRPQLHRSTARTVRDVVRRVLDAPAPDAVIEVTGGALDPVGCFQALFLHLSDGGLYLTDPGHLAPALAGHLDTLVGVRDRIRAHDLTGEPDEDLPEVRHDDLERAVAIRRLVRHASLTVVERAGDHLVKVRDRDLTRVISVRVGPERVAELFGRAAGPAEPRCTTWVNREPTPPGFPVDRVTPDLYARIYHDVVCGPRQLVLIGDVVPSIAFRRPLGRRLRSRATVDVGPNVTRLRKPLRTIRTLRGTYYHLDSEFPGRFGHFMTEDLGRLWGWAEARAEYPDLRLLISGARRGERLPSYAAGLLTAYGIAQRDIVCIDRPHRVERLIGVSPMFHAGRYAHPELAGIWSGIGTALAPAPARTDRRLFVSPPASSPRSPRNAAEVQAWFAAAGFELLAPETLPLAEQVRRFAESAVVAGFAGPGLTGAVFAPPGVRIVLGSDRDPGTAPWLIAGVQGGSYHHFYGCGRTDDDWSVDVDRDGPALRALLDRL